MEGSKQQSIFVIYLVRATSPEKELIFSPKLCREQFSAERKKTLSTTQFLG